MAEPTRYEIVARHKDGREYLIAYSARKSLPGLQVAIVNQGKNIARACNLEDDSVLSIGRDHLPFAECEDWWFGFSGRTQKEVHTLRDEKPFVNDVANSVKG